MLEEMDNWSHPPLFPGVRNLPSRTQPLSIHADQMRWPRKLDWASGETRAPIGLERIFQRSTETVDSPLAATMSKLPPRVPWRIIQQWKCICGKNDVEGLPHAVNNPLQLPRNSRQGSIVSLIPMTHIC